LKYLKNDFQVQIAYGRGTRSASMVERYIYRFAIGSDGRDYIGNPYLKPEVNNQFDFSVSKYFSNFSIGGNVFYSLMENYITSRLNSYFMRGVSSGGCSSGPIRAPKQFWNVNAYQYGFEAFVKYNIIKALQFSSDIAYTVAENTTFREPLAQIAPMTVHVGLKWEKSNYWLDLRTRIVSKQDRFSKTYDETETPGYSILDFRAGIKLFNSLTIGGAALNIFDKAYYNHLNFGYNNSDKNEGRILETGRNFSVYMKYKF
jgi:iron complex outermembrane receptor protein